MRFVTSPRTGNAVARLPEWLCKPACLAGAMALATVATVTTVANGQDVSQPARFGAVNLETGFTPDPYIEVIAAGGRDDVSGLADGCTGFIRGDRPDYQVTFSAGTFRLGVFARSDADTTLVINDPNGGWHCNDDHSDLGGVNPGVVFDDPVSGRYDVWVGLFSADGEDQPAELLISEGRAPWEPRYGSVALAAGFDPDPHSVEVQAGGADAAGILSNGCNGFVDGNKPDYAVDYQSGRFSMGMFVLGEVDTTLVVRDPNGGWTCNDDFSEAGGQNPGVQYNDPADGTYSIWVGTYEQRDTGSEVRLLFTERAPPWGGEEPGAEGGEPGLVSSGTGFFVSENGHILTNQHVIEGCTRTTVQVRGGAAVDAVVLASNTGVDLALLQTSGPVAAATASFRGSRNVRLGEEVVVYGFPLLGDLSSQGNLTVGIVSALSGLEDDLSRMQLSAQIQPGNSGGPVMDRQGNIIGVVVERANDEYFLEKSGAVPQNVNFAIRDGLARSFLDTNNVPYAVSEGVERMAIVDIADRAQDFTGVILCYQ